ncbi:cytochrome c biogenesis protein ResB [Desulfuromonas sp. AOP6]|uniref:cytochrome c biogenesis protein ResB n=1 Tax=Desulfuromonas sp. AOP6 TaxID=1566351 RepID=UPI0012846CB3|nr:cytochrome c biogenesis protein ResB [Desulfuromonas sp. AOP6]BCA80495.1 hypothetical protein AOP6_2282 [Desulfuromonas sp. AOP6]
MATQGNKIWYWLTSLKLAIVLASLATLVIMIGSLVMHYHPRLFGDLDAVTLGTFYPAAARQAPLLTLWMPVAALLIIAFAVNTLCCFLDWLPRLRSRWRKTGEYLIHLGFCLLVVAFFWGQLSGYRTAGNLLAVGETRPLHRHPGLSLRLDDFQPVFDESGRRPLDMFNELTLLRNGEEIVRQQVRTNHPLSHQGLIILASSFQQEASGFSFHAPGFGRLDLQAGSRLELPGDATLAVLDFLPTARRLGERVVAMGTTLNDPALHLQLTGGDGQIRWQGWYFLRQGPPAALAEQGLHLRPLQPVVRTSSVLTINYDPGASLALTGGVLMGTGVLIAIVSYYAKRRRQDRPLIV